MALSSIDSLAFGQNFFNSQHDVYSKIYSTLLAHKENDDKEKASVKQVIYEPDYITNSKSDSSFKINPFTTVKKFIKCAVPSRENLLKAVYANNINLIEHISKANKTIIAYQCDELGRSVLFRTIENETWEKFEMAKILIGLGANYNLANKEGTTPLEVAIKTKNISLVVFLKMIGAAIKTPPTDEESQKVISRANEIIFDVPLQLLKGARDKFSAFQLPKEIIYKITALYLGSIFGEEFH